MATAQTPRRRAFLEAVRDGRVVHVHPFHFVVPLELLDYKGAQRTFQSLHHARLIQVDAGSREYHRPVTLTNRGQVALGLEPKPAP